MPVPKTEAEFMTYVRSYTRMGPEELLQTKKGGFLRYAIDTIEDGVVKHTYGGGYLTAVDPYLDHMTLVIGRKRIWHVKLNDPTRMIRMYYKPKVGRAEEEIAVFRKLLQQLEAGEIEIVPKK